MATSTQKKVGYGGGLAAFLAALYAFFHITTAPPKPTTGDSTATPPVVVDTVKHDTTPRDTTTPPVVTPPAGGSYRTLVADSMNYRTQADFLARVSKGMGGTGTGKVIYTDGYRVTQAVVDTTIKCDGHATLRYPQPANVGAMPELWMSIPPTRHTRTRYVVRFAPGWTTVGNGYTYTKVDANGKPVDSAGSSQAYKLFGWGIGSNSATAVDGSGRIEISNGTQYQLYFSAKRRSDNAPVYAIDYDLKGLGNVTTQWSDGQFYDYIVDVDYSNNSSGTARAWMAKHGTDPNTGRAAKVTIPLGAGMPQVYVTSISDGMNYNQSRGGKPAQFLNVCASETVDAAQYPTAFGVQ